MISSVHTCLEGAEACGSGAISSESEEEFTVGLSDSDEADSIGMK